MEPEAEEQFAEDRNVAHSDAKDTLRKEEQSRAHESAHRLEPYRGLIADLITQGGPTDADFAALTAYFCELNRLVELDRLSLTDLRRFIIGFGDPFANSHCLVGEVLASPFHGHFQIMEKIYANAVSEHPQLYRWDLWFQHLDAVQAVRNRKRLLVRVLNDFSYKVPEGSKVAVFGCGSCREILEHLEQIGPKLHFDCIDHDEEAIAYAKKLLSRFTKNITFFHGNALRFHSRERYVLTYAAGLSDYLDDRKFVTFIRRLGKILVPSGWILVGNFAPNYLARGAMRCAGWVLYERSVESLLHLARLAGYAPKNAWVTSEEAGVNLFLNISMN